MSYGQHGGASNLNSSGQKREGDSSEPEPRTLLVDATLTAMRLPSGKEVAFRRRRVARRIFAALTQRKLAGDRTPLSSAQLIEIGWPGERILPSAARNRLYVLMSKLRRVGIGEILRAGPRGYFLSHDLDIRVVGAIGERVTIESTPPVPALEEPEEPGLSIVEGA